VYTSNYVTYRLDCNDGRQGGVAILAKQELPCKLIDLPNPTHQETLWLLYRQPCMPRVLTHILIGCVYFPPNANIKVMNDHILDSLDIVSRKHTNLGILLVGDFNHLPDKPLLSFPLKQIVKCSTRGLATLDKIYTNISHWFSEPLTLPALGKSDHCSVLLTPSVNPPPPHGYYQRVKRRSNDPNGKALLCLALKQHNWTTLYSISSCEDMTCHFCTTLITYLDYFLPMLEHNVYTTEKQAMG